MNTRPQHVTASGAPTTKRTDISVGVASVADVVLASGGVVSVAALLFFAYHYTWVRDREFSSLLGMLVYIFLPAATELLFFTSFALMTPSQRINLAIVCSSIAIALGAGEAIAATILSSVERAHWLDLRQRADIARRGGRTFDRRTPLELIHHLRDQGIDAVGYVSPMEAYIGPAVQKYQDAPFLRLDGQDVIPLGGISRRPTILCNEAGEYVTYDSDEHGFNNPKGLWSAGASDILIVGDSFAHGACVPSDKSFGALLRQRYPKTISVGYMGNGPLVELAALAEYGPFLKPSVVLWCYYEGNDLLDLRNERNSRLLDRYMTDAFTYASWAFNRRSIALSGNISRGSLSRARQLARNNGWALAPLLA